MSDLWIGAACAPDSLAPTDERALLDSDDLTRHAVCLGMTGSGKTGLCLGLLEELGLAGVPILAVDPKGDLTNLALCFPALTAEDFAPWIDPGAARRAGREPAVHAEHVARTWREGLASQGIGPDRLQQLADRTHLSILTPGSEAGTPVDVLSTLSTPPGALDGEALAAHVTGVVTALLGLVGRTADPVRDPAAVVLARILADAWNAGDTPDLAGLLRQLLDPPFDVVGLFPLATFFPRDDRMELALQFNAILASPSFAAFRRGVPLDVDAWLSPRADGTTPVTVITLSHLGDAERTFVLSLLLHQVVAWSRRQSGTSRLRALLYLDEVMGMLPPHPSNAPTKAPILTLMKQARAVGLGTMLCTQNPVDVDYKALSNAGTWFVGRLQTAQDRDRVLDGLVTADAALDRRAASDVLGRLPKRTFLQRTPGGAPTIVRARWAMSYLRGPLTRAEIPRLRALGLVDDEPVLSAEAPPAATAPEGSPTPPIVPEALEVGWLDPGFARGPALRDVLPGRPPRPGEAVLWAPTLLLRVALTFDERGWSVDEDTWHLAVPLDEDPPTVHAVALPSAAVHRGSPEGRFLPLPPHLDEDRELDRFRKALVDGLTRDRTVPMHRHRALRLVSLAGETAEAFRARVAAAANAEIREDAADLQERVDDKLRKLEARQRDAEARVAEAESDVSASGVQEAVNAGEVVLSLFMGRRRSTTSLVSRRRSVMKAKERVRKAQDRLAEIEADILDLHEDTAVAIEGLEGELASMLDAIETKDVGLEASDVDVVSFTLLWVPVG